MRRGSLVCRLGTLLGVLGLWARAVAAAQSAPPTDAPTGAPLSGVIVREAPGRRPVADAVVTVGATGLTTRSDTLGRFRFPAVPDGAHLLTARAVGFEASAQRIVVAAGQPLALELRLTPLPELAAVEVNAERYRSPNLRDFDERRRTGLGRFLTAEELADHGGRSLSSILRRRMPGLRAISYASGRTAMASARGITSRHLLPSGDGIDRSLGAPAECYVQVSVNDVLRYRGNVDEQLYNIDLIDSATIEGIEFYTVSQLPAEFNRASNSSCGALVIWLKP